MKIIGKIIAIPFAIVLTLFSAVIRFLFCFASSILTILSGGLGLLSIAMFVTGCMLNNCIWVMVFAFLLSPFGIQAVAEWLIDGIDGLSNRLQFYIMD